VWALGYTLPEVLAFLASIVFLSLVSYYDLKNRHVENMIMVVSAIIGTLLTLLSGHLFQFLLQHLLAVSVTLLLATVLFRTGAIGGADFKSLLIISVMSPGAEFHDVINPLFEGVIVPMIQVLLMLVLGQIWCVFNRRNKSDGEVTPPLLPFLLAGYLVLQTIPLLVMIML